MFYQNSAAREPPGPVPSLADGHCCTCVEVVDAFWARPLNFSEIFRTASRNCFAPAHRVTGANRNGEQTC